jgi:hypothetical protein
MTDDLGDRLAAAIDAAAAPVEPAEARQRGERQARRRAAILVSMTLVALVVVVAAGAYAATGSRHAVSVTPAGPGTDNTSTTAPRPVQIPDIEHPTFAIFDSSPTRVLPDRKLWRVAQFDGEELWISRTNVDPTCLQATDSTTSSPSEPCRTTPQHCLILDTPPGIEHGGWCEGTGNQLIGWWYGSTQGEFANGQPVQIYGVVPDDVSRVTYEGRDVPVTNNVFVLIDPGPIDPPKTGLPLIYVVGDCQIPMYVQGQSAMYPRGDDGFTFDPRVRCNGPSPSSSTTGTRSLLPQVSRS